MIPKLALKYANNGGGFQTDLMTCALKEHGLVRSVLESPNKSQNWALGALPYSKKHQIGLESHLDLSATSIVYL